MDAYQKRQQVFRVLRKRLTAQVRIRDMNRFRSGRRNIGKMNVFVMDLMWPKESVPISKTLIHHIVEILFSIKSFFLQSTNFLIHKNQTR